MGEVRPRRRPRWKHLWVVLGVLLVAAFIPTPAARVHPGPLWEQTTVLNGVRPASSSSGWGSPYAPIGVVALQYLGLDISFDPSGSTLDRYFEFEDEPVARAAATEAVRTAIRLGYDMQSNQWGGGIWEQGEGVWGDDGSSPDGTLRFSVWERVEPTVGFSVQLHLEHYY